MILNLIEIHTYSKPVQILLGEPGETDKIYVI